MKLEIVEDWKHAWKWISMWCMTIAMAIQGAWTFIPDDMKASIPHSIVEGATVALLGIGIVGRLTKQTKADVAGDDSANQP
jgi:hypothetical protein